MSPSETSPARRVVAPYAGAWIEISTPCRCHAHGEVAPYAGAWIEISPDANIGKQKGVAPYAGAWIEIPAQHPLPIKSPSRPTRARGLKSGKLADEFRSVMSRPTRARGLKCMTDVDEKTMKRSRPTRARGLKCKLSKHYASVGCRALRGRVD